MRTKNMMVLLMLWLAALGVNAQTIERFTFSGINTTIPDGTPSGMIDNRTVTSSIQSISKVRVKLTLTGKYMGDIYAYLVHMNAGRTDFCVLLNRVGRTSGNSSGYPDTGLDITLDSSAANDIHNYRNVTTPPAGSSLTGLWQPDGRNADPYGVTDTSGRATSLVEFTGTGGSGEWTLFVADLDSGAPNMLVGWELELTGGIAPTITWATPASITYGTALSGMQLNASSGGIPGTFTYTPAAGTILNAGNNTLSVLFTPTDTTTYTPATKTVTLAVNKKTLTVAANDTGKVYGAAVPVLTQTYAGFIAGDSTAKLTSQPTLATTATTGSPAGTYPITPSGGVSSNYVFAYQAGTLTVSKAPLTITANNATKVYGAALPAFAAAYSGFVNGDTALSLSPAVSFTTTATATSPVASYPITPGSAANPNYTISFVNGTLSVTKATLTITANNATKAYGAAVPALGASYSGFVGTDTAASLTPAPTVTTTATAASPVNTYPITASGTGSANYNFNYVAGTLTVTKASLNIDVNDASKFYGAALPAFSATYTGFVNGDTAANLSPAPTFTTTATASSPVGSYPVTAGGADSPNYTISYTAGALTVNKAALVITANNATKLYGAGLPALSASYSGFVLTDTATVLSPAPTLATTATASSPAGNYPITAAGAGAVNYSISYVAGTLTVGKAPLTITANNATKVFGAALPAFSSGYNGFVNGDTVGSLTTPVTYSTAATASSPVGSYAIGPAGATSPNYSISFVPGTLTIIKSSSAATIVTSRNPANPGTPVTFTFTATAVAPGVGAPDGLVVFKVDNVAAATVALSGGVASYTTSGLSAGTHSISGDYGGSGNFNGTTALLSPAQSINSAPVAGADAIDRYPTNGTKVEISALLSNDSDPDGDSFSFTSVASTSARGGTLTQSAGWIYYTPAPGFTGVDTFTYLITDSKGATGTGTVTINLKPTDGPALNLTITDEGGGLYLLRFYGIPNRLTRIDYSPATNPPVWNPLSQGYSDAFGVYEYEDLPPNGIDARLYRAVYP